MLQCLRTVNFFAIPTMIQGNNLEVLFENKVQNKQQNWLEI